MAARIATRSHHQVARRGAAVDAAVPAANAMVAGLAAMAGTSPAMNAGTVARRGIGPTNATRRKEMRRPIRPEGNEALLVATATVTFDSSPPTPPAAVPAIHINEDNLFVHLGDGRERECTRWILDTGATNHMTSLRSAFSELDTGVHGTIKFDDGSVIGIEGRGTVLFNCKNGEHQALTGVYHIPRLTANIVSLGQLEEDGFKILLENGFLRIWDQRRRRLLAKVPRAANRLYQLTVDIAKPVCLAAQGTDAA
ncbi:hypothetical protein U9M48_030555 [Paspalum notatum var. saurae]|uniref:Retrovirus-related Pol polyprotein from transposon TNT 1-94-like beta-barrel domain-containing protein n=1 Tax=Paspalum notatum var. saurae TaxID=547442 RepID=A0AAQ3U0M7_PASNO